MPTVLRIWKDRPEALFDARGIRSIGSMPQSCCCAFHYPLLHTVLLTSHKHTDYPRVPLLLSVRIYVDTTMALGVLEPKAQKVPGTANVLDQEWKRDPTLKRDKTGNIILVPQPSEDPNDPLVR